MKKFYSFLMGIFLISSNLGCLTTYAKDNSIVNENMSINEIIEIASNNEIILNVDNMSSINKIQKKEMVNTINNMYLEELNSAIIENSNNTKSIGAKALNSGNSIAPLAIDGSVSKKTLSSYYTGTQDIDYNPISYKLLVEVKCDVYSDNSSKQIVKVYSDTINSYIQNSVVSYTHVDSWYTLPSSGKYVKIGGQGHINASNKNRIVPFSVTIYV